MSVCIPALFLDCIANFILDVAVITGIYLASYNIGSALGNSVSGAIWSQIIPTQLTRELGSAQRAQAWFAEPLTLAASFAPGTRERDAAIEAYKHVQRLLCITGICLCAALIFFACVLRDPKLGKEQSLPDAETRNGTHSESPEVTDGESHQKKSLFAFFKR